MITRVAMIAIPIRMPYPTVSKRLPLVPLTLAYIELARIQGAGTTV